MAGDKPDPKAEKACAEPGFWQNLGEKLHLVDKSCNASVEAMKPPTNANAQKELPNLLIEGVEAAKRQGRTGTINKQEAEMLKEI